MHSTLLTRLLPFLLALASCALLSPANAATPTAPARISAQDGSYRIPFDNLLGSTLPIELRGAEARKVLSFPVPPRMEIESAEVEFTYVNSISMLNERSQLAVTLNERILAQIPLRTDQAENTARMSLPSALLTPGYHDFGFRAAQHYTYKCEDGSAPELFSQIDTQASAFLIRAQRKPVALSLGRLNEVFDARLWLNQFPLSIISSDPDLIEASSLAAQGVALRLEFIPVHVEQELAHAKTDPTEMESDLQDPGKLFPNLSLPQHASSDIILIGSKPRIAGLVSATLLERIQGAYIGIYPLDGDPTRAVILISGSNNNEVLEAARVFAYSQFALPDRQDIHIAELELPESFRRLQGSHTELGAIEPGWISFRALGFATSTLKGSYPRPAELSFWAFSEMFDPKQRHLDADLVLAYGAGFDQNSALNVFLNGEFIQAIHLNDPHGAQLWRSRINIPIAQLQAGRNTLSFTPSVIGKDVGGECRPIFSENLYVSIADNSRLALPSGGGAMRLPDLALLSRTGLPYTQSSDGFGSSMLISDEHPSTANAALTLVSKLAQINKAPLSGMRVLNDPSKLQSPSNVLIVGSPARIGSGLRDEVSAFLPHVHWQSLAVGARETAIPASLRSWLNSPLQTPLNRTERQTQSAKLRLDNDLGQSAAAVQFQSTRLGGSVTLLSAATPELLEQGVSRLVQFSTWGALNGNGMLWSSGENGSPRAFSFPEHHHYVGDITPVTLISLLLNERPYLLLGIALSIVVGTAIVIWLALRRRAKNLA